MNTSRWKEHHLTADSRPRKVYEYYVTGRGLFPYDMLRHDNCWPATSEDAVKMDMSHASVERRRELRSIRMRSYRSPTLGRWESFGWSVGLEKLDEIEPKESVPPIWESPNWKGAKPDEK